MSTLPAIPAPPLDQPHSCWELNSRLARTWLLAGALALSGQAVWAQSWDGRPGAANADWRDQFRNFNATEADDPAGSANSTLLATTANTWRIRKPIGRKRAEASRALGWTPIEGQTYYLKWRLSVTSTNPSATGFSVFQWKTDDGGNLNTSKQNYPFNLTYDGDNLVFSAYDPGEPNWTAGSSIQLRRNILWDGPLPQGKAVDIVIGVKVSQNIQQGSLELWVNGQLQPLSNGQTRVSARTMDGVVVYPKWGVYGGASRPYDVTTEVSGLQIDQTRPSAVPKPTPRPDPAPAPLPGPKPSPTPAPRPTPAPAPRPTPAPQPTTTIASGATYKITNRQTGRALDVARASNENGANVGTWPFRNAAHQRWVVKREGSHYVITAQHSGQALNIAGGAGGTNLVQWPYRNDANAQWRLVARGGGYFEILSTLTGQAVDEAVDERNALPYARHGKLNQQWRFERLN